MLMESKNDVGQARVTRIVLAAWKRDGHFAATDAEGQWGARYILISDEGTTQTGAMRPRCVWPALRRTSAACARMCSAA